jgi:hypothetical protein
VNTDPDRNKATALTATGQTKAAAAKAAAAPRIKLLSDGFCIDHPDPELGEQLMADALGLADRDAMGRDRRAKADSGLVGRSAEVFASDEVICFRKAEPHGL